MTNDGVLFEVSESAAAQRLGCSRAELRHMRQEGKSIRGEDWDLVGTTVRYAEPSLKKMAAMLNGQPLETEAAAAGLAPPPPARTGVATVTQVFLKNHKFLSASVDGQPVRVRVRDNSHFMPGMTMEVHLAHDDLWEFIGRCPRGKGRW